MRQNLKKIKLTFFTLFAILIVASSPVRAEDSNKGTCTKADVDDALGDSPSCSTEGVVFFGTDVSEFIANQCAPISMPNETDAALKKAKSTCMQCAKLAWEAFQAAARAKLIPDAKASKVNFGRIKAICKDSNDGSDDPEDGALGSMFQQLRLCFPQEEGHSVNASECSSCAKQVLDSALSDGVVSPQQYTTILKTAKQGCEHQNTGGGDEGGGDNPPSTPDAEQTYFNSIRACLVANQASPNPSTCLACISAVSTEGVPDDKVEYVTTHATAACNSSFTENP